MPLDLALDLAHALDPVAFVQDRLNFEPDPWQARLLRSRAPWILLNCCRQSGKSTTTAALALHTAIYDPGLTLLVSPSLRQSKELFAKVTGFLKDLEPAEVLEEDNKSCCTLGQRRAPCLPARGPRHAARLLRAKADHQRRSRLCERCDAGGARPDARRLKSGDRCNGGAETQSRTGDACNRRHDGQRRASQARSRSAPALIASPRSQRAKKEGKDRDRAGRRCCEAAEKGMSASVTAFWETDAPLSVG